MSTSLDDLINGAFSPVAVVQPPRENPDDFEESPPVTAGDGAGYDGELAAVVSADELQYARDCFFVYNNLMEGRLTKERCGSSARYAVAQFARANTKEFLGQILPKCQQRLQLANVSKDDDIVIIEERKAVGELQDLLRAAVKEAEAMAIE